MQVRFNDSKVDRNMLIKQLVFWSPLRVFGILFFVLASGYLLTGHDEFMYSIFGYESENKFEARINPRGFNNSVQTTVLADKKWVSPLREREPALHTVQAVDVLR